MKQVHIFLITSAKTPGRHKEAWYRYILVCDGKTLDQQEYAKDISGNRLIMACAIEALKRMTKPAMITIHTDSYYLTSGHGKLARWKDDGWKRQNKKEVKNADLWKQLEALMRPHAVRFKVEPMEMYMENPPR